MPKRKRDGQVIGQDEDSRKRADLDRQIVLGKRQITRNLKLAKGFERQKLGRREKDARAKEDNEEILKIEAEILALKSVDIPTSAEHHLHKTLLKTKRIKESGLLPNSVQLPQRTNVDIATSNVTARMFNAKLVKGALTQTLHAIRSIIGIPEEKSTPLKTGSASHKVEPAKTTGFKPRQRSLSISSASEDEEETGESEVTLSSESETDSESTSPKVDVDNDEFDSEAFAAFDARIASTSTEDDENDISNGESGSVVSAALDFQLRREILAAIIKSKGKGAPANAVDQADTSSVSSTDVEGSAGEGNHLGTETMSDSTGTTTTVKRPAKSAAVARRMILSHLGIRQPRATNVKSSGATSTDGESWSPIPSPTGNISSPDSLEIASDSQSSPPPQITLPIAPPKPQKTTKALPETAKEELTRLVKESKAATKAQKSAKSTFLPSLADGAYWSGSESAPSDIDEHVAPRKNRRGQRARQKIAEAKFGKSAKHLAADKVAAAKSKKGRDDGWDAKRGATDGGWKKGRGSTWKGTDFSGNTGSNAIPVMEVKNVEKRKRANDDEGPLHPSWEAKKLAKSKDAIVKFEGKKITFD